MRRLVLSEPVTRDALLDFFHDTGWTYIQEHVPTEGDRLPHSIGWSKGDHDEHRVHFIHDRELGAQYFVLQSQEPDKEAVIESRVRSGPFKFLSPEQIVKDFDDATRPADLTRGFARLVLIAPEKHEPQFAARIERVLKHPDPAVRAQGLAAFTYLGWPELKPLIEDSSRDPDEQVRRNAETILDGYRELGIT